jgi:zinc transporter, ZIP family
MPAKQAPNSNSFSRPAVVASALLPLAAIAAILYLFLSRGTGLNLHAPAPIENLSFERVQLRPGEIELSVLNSGPEPLKIAQVQVGWTNRANWEFEVQPGPTIKRLDRATVHIPYPWIAGEPYHVVLITANSLLFTHEIPIAAETPQIDSGTFGKFALLGIYVGVLPVFLGIGWLPFLRSLPQRWYYSLLSLTSGLLVFLGVDALHEAFENAEEVPAPFQGTAIILIGFLLSIGLLYAVSGWLRGSRQSSTKASEMGAALILSYSIAFGIGVHNLGEGLAIGGAYALGEFAAGTMLILGFTMHNLTEGVAVVAPLLTGQAKGSPFRWIHLLWLGALAGGPTIVGTVLGATAFSATWAVLFLAIGAGAVFQVVIELTRHLVSKQGVDSLYAPHNLAGFAAGLAIMFITGLFITV